MKAIGKRVATRLLPPLCAIIGLPIKSIADLGQNHAAKQRVVEPIGEEGEAGRMGEEVGKVGKRGGRKTTKSMKSRYSIKTKGLASASGSRDHGSEMAKIRSVESEMGGKMGLEGWFSPRTLLFGANGDEAYNADTAIRLISYASLAWSVTYLSPMIFEMLNM